MDRSAAKVALRCLAVAGITVLAGCTMCPDPYDYSGPVPNGSAPQNDFRVRSNGILPLGAAPVPWPTVVRGDAAPGQPARSGTGRRLGMPTPADDEPVIVVAAETDADRGPPPSVLVASGTEPTESMSKPPRDPWQVVPDFGDEDVMHEPLTPATPDEQDDHAGAEADQSTEAMPPADPSAGQPDVVLPRLAETPGWRPRGSR